MDLSRRRFLSLVVPPRPTSAAWAIEISPDLCFDCRACIRVCPQRALGRDDGDEMVVYHLRAQACDGCAKCVDICAAQAIRLKPAGPQRPVPRTRVAVLPVVRCRTCGRRIASKRPVCDNCRTHSGLLGRGPLGR